MSFDLSSRCIGVICARIEDRKIINILSCPIVPPKFNPASIGFSSSRKKILTSKGKEINTYLKPGETTISKQEKKQRDSYIRSQKDLFILKNISKSIDTLVDGIKPDIILVEKNSIFNGVLTSVLLGKVAGVLLGLAGRLSIPVIEYPVKKVREPYNVGSLIKEFAKKHSEEELRKIPDITKRALRELMEEKYKINFQTDDESDACVVFDYWYNTEYLQG